MRCPLARRSHAKAAQRVGKKRGFAVRVVEIRVSIEIGGTNQFKSAGIVGPGATTYFKQLGNTVWRAWA